MPELNEAVIVAATRTPIGRANKGSLANVRADELLAGVLNDLMAKVPVVQKGDVQDIVAGNVAQTGETGFSVARTAGILAGFPNEVPGHVVQRFCASSLQAISHTANSVKVGEGDIYIACGVEKSSVPPPPEGSEGGGGGGARRGGGIGPGGLNPKLLGRDSGFPFVYIPMGLTAENVVEKFGVKREDMDAFAKLSQDRAVESQKNGVFEWEISPVTKEDGTVVTQDDGPRPNTTLEALAALKPVFKPEGGSVTAGNSCPLNDGAAAVMIMSRQRADALGLTPLARIIATAYSGNNPEIMGVAPIDAIKKVLDMTGMTIKDIDFVELNEAFAAQVLPVAEHTGIDIEKQLNVHGGAIALGHPFGMTGARIMTTLLNVLRTENGTIGLETMCAAGGMAMATIIERIS
jgi:acetyl-CoA C-acetyltransferase